jgi:hypothetical protein
MVSSGLALEDLGGGHVHQDKAHWTDIVGLHCPNLEKGDNECI